jgi:NADH:ubiquinone reductase (H+-translocating)
MIMTTKPLPRVCIVGGGFAGLEAAKALAGAPVHLTLIDRRNHHVFQPLLYQVATASLSPADISAPIRSVLRGQANCGVVLSEVTGVDVARRRVLIPGGHVPYDYLILAAGATHAYFGHDDWAPLAPGLKTLEDAIELRRRILLAFETAEYEGSAEARRAALTFGIVGGGPTGVELAGAIKEIAGQTIPEDYRHIDTRTTRVIVFEGGPRLLATFHPDLSARAQKDLERMGVEVRLNTVVTGVTLRGVRVGDEFIPVGSVFWAAGVKASPLGRGLVRPAGPIRTRRRRAGSDDPRAPGGLRHGGSRGRHVGRHGTPRPRRGPGGDPDGTLRGAHRRRRSHRTLLARSSRAVRLQGQGIHGHHRQGAGRGPDRAVPLRRVRRLAALGRRAHPIADRIPAPGAGADELVLELDAERPRRPADHGERADGPAGAAPERIRRRCARSSGGTGRGRASSHAAPAGSSGREASALTRPG